MNLYGLSEKYEKFRRSLVRHSLIQISDNGKISVEDCKKVLCFDENTIKILVPSGKITVTGLDMKMRNYSEHGIVITGKLHSIGFDDSGKER